MGPLWLLTLLPGVIGQTLISVLKEHDDTLGTLNFYIAKSRSLTTLLSTANNFTFLAPSNEAFDEWLINKGSTPLSADEIDATLAYHLLHGGFPTVAFTTNPHFVPTNLTDLRFANVTTGQTVELQLAENGARFVSGNKSVSTVKLPDIVCTGGIIHIVNSLLRIPPGLVTLLTQSNLNSFIGGYLDAASQPLVRPVVDSPNNTIFAPNTAVALSTFKNRTKNASQQELGAVFNYHVVPNFLGYSTTLQDGMVLKTDEGSDLYITVQGNDTFVNSAKIVTSDCLVSNGVLHTIDG
ncbi:FAS1 domain-containing protein [Leptodontidium sp. 2 PMI_412]|nr:FAS1 domain-containing protein [Leptodontidium sp. 2 PMI_412]